MKGLISPQPTARFNRLEVANTNAAAKGVRMEMIRGQYRFRNPIDYRYIYYAWPASIVARCIGCGAKIAFTATVPNRFVKNESSGGYGLPLQHVGGPIRGSSACTKCGRIFNQMRWPQDAYYRFKWGAGEVWAWNEKYLDALRAKVSGDRVLERHLCMQDGLYHYFLARMPKHVVVKRNRARILRAIDEAMGPASGLV